MESYIGWPNFMNWIKGTIPGVVTDTLSGTGDPHLGVVDEEGEGRRRMNV